MERTKPFYVQTKLVDYVPLPRSLLGEDLSSTALLLYGALLDRATLSQKNGYTDELGRVYVIYPLGAWHRPSASAIPPLNGI